MVWKRGINSFQVSVKRLINLLNKLCCAPSLFQVPRHWVAKMNGLQCLAPRASDSRNMDMQTTTACTISPDSWALLHTFRVWNLRHFLALTPHKQKSQEFFNFFLPEALPGYLKLLQATYLSTHSLLGLHLFPCVKRGRWSSPLQHLALAPVMDWNVTCPTHHQPPSPGTNPNFEIPTPQYLECNHIWR